MKQNNGTPIAIEEGSGNVFADLGFPDAEEHRTKAEIVMALAEAIRAGGLTQAEAAEKLGIDQPKVSAILRGQFRGFSLERLLRLITALNINVRIRIEAKSRVSMKAKKVTPGRVFVESAYAKKSRASHRVASLRREERASMKDLPQ